MSVHMTTTSTEARFRAAFDAYYRAIFSYAARRAGRDAAADIAADVFTTAWRRIGHMPLEPDSLPWLYGVARKTVSNHHRSRTRQRALHLKVVSVKDTPTNSLDDVLAVRRELEKLKDDDREILMLAAWEELTPSEIATALGITPEASRVRLHRARQRLAERLGTDFGETNS